MVAVAMIASGMILMLPGSVHPATQDKSFTPDYNPSNPAAYYDFVGTSSGYVYSYDPFTLAQYAVNLVNMSGVIGLQTLGDYVYAYSSGSPTSVYKLNASTLATISSRVLPVAVNIWSGLDAATQTSTDLYYEDVNGNVTEISPSLSTVASTTSGIFYGAIAYDGTYIVASNGAGPSIVSRLNPSTLASTGTTTLPNSNSAYYVAYAPNVEHSLWFMANGAQNPQYYTEYYGTSAYSYDTIGNGETPTGILWSSYSADWFYVGLAGSSSSSVSAFVPTQPTTVVASWTSHIGSVQPFWDGHHVFALPIFSGEPFSVLNPNLSFNRNITTNGQAMAFASNNTGAVSYYTITITEGGLPSGDSWIVYWAGENTSQTNTIVLHVPPGDIYLTVAGPSGYAVNGSNAWSGNVQSDISLGFHFYKQDPSMYTNPGYYAGIFTLVAIVLVIMSVGLFFFFRIRKGGAK